MQFSTERTKNLADFGCYDEAARVVGARAAKKESRGSLGFHEVLYGALVSEGRLGELHLIGDAIHFHIAAVGKLGIGLVVQLAAESISAEDFEQVAAVFVVAGSGGAQSFHILNRADGADFLGFGGDNGDMRGVGLVLEGNRAAVLGAGAVKRGDIGQDAVSGINAGGIYHTLDDITEDIVVGVGKAGLGVQQIGVDGGVFHRGQLLSSQKLWFEFVHNAEFRDLPL